MSVTKKNIYNPFLSIKLHTSLGFLLVDNLNKKNYKLSNNINYSDLLRKFKIEDKSLIYKLSKNSKFWFDYNCVDALNYHVHCYRYPFLDYEDGSAFIVDKARMAEYEKKDSMPSFFKTYKKKKIYLGVPKPYPNYSIENAMQSIVADLSGSSVKDLFNQFVYACLGNTLDDETENRFIKKTIPSGGAKHPTEAYFIFPKNSIYPEGVYHYNVMEHALDVIFEGSCWQKFVEETYFIFEDKGENQFGVVYTSLVERAMFRYRDLRSTRAILADAAHVLQNSKLVGYALGFDSVTSYKSKETGIKKLLRISKNNEPVISTQTFFINSKN